MAYGLERRDEYLLTGGAQSILSERFNIVAKPPDDSPPGQKLLMLRTLLAERFNLEIHAETRQIPIYALTVARKDRLGSQLRPSIYNCVELLKVPRENRPQPTDANGRLVCPPNQYEFNTPGRGALTIRYASPIDFLVKQTKGFVDRPLVDATGLSGSFEWVLSFSATDSFDSQAPSIYTAFQEQLGLRLESRRGPFQVLVIDSVQMPTPD